MVTDAAMPAAEDLESAAAAAGSIKNFRSYTFPAYVADRWWSLLIGGLVLVSLGFVGVVLGLTVAGLIIIESVAALGGIALLLIDYLRRHRFYRDLEELDSSVESNTHLIALLDRPDFLEGALTATALEDVIRRGEADAATVQRAFDDYRRYIETWVHEVKTPLAAARLMTARIEGRDGFNLSRELDRIEGQVQTILYYARTSTMAQDYHLRRIELGSVLREVCRKNARLLIEQGCTPSIELDAVAVVCDRQWLGFIVTQIVVNAAKYGAKTITFRIADRAEDTSAGHTTLEIADDGWGISAADAPRVFERGFTGENGRSLSQATGMGLYLVATMAEAMGIGVGLATEPGAGTRVYLRFPHAFEG